MIGFFKDPVLLNYQRGAGDEVGHYTAAIVHPSGDPQMLGKNNCLLTAFAQARGKNSGLIDDRIERQKLMQYTHAHSQTFMKSFNNIAKKGRNPLMGGARVSAGDSGRAFARSNNQSRHGVVKQVIEQMSTGDRPLLDAQSKFISEFQQGLGSLSSNGLDMAHEVSAESTGKLLARLSSMPDASKYRKFYNDLVVERVPEHASEIMNCFDQFTDHSNTPSMKQEAVQRTLSIFNTAPGNLRPAYRSPNRSIGSNLDLNLSLGKEGYYIGMNSAENRAYQTVLSAVIGLSYNEPKIRRRVGDSRVEVQSSNVDPDCDKSYASYRRHSLSILMGPDNHNKSYASDRRHSSLILMEPDNQIHPSPLVSKPSEAGMFKPKPQTSRKRPADQTLNRDLNKKS